MIKQQVVRYHDFCAGHRVVGHESKCAHLHGHNYRIHFHVESTESSLDEVGRVVDFSVIKSTLCEWLEEHWDHRMLLWEEDPYLTALQSVDKKVVAVPFNPTAENIGNYLLEEICPVLMQGKGLKVTKLVIEETRKCSIICEETK